MRRFGRRDFFALGGGAAIGVGASGMRSPDAPTPPPVEEVDNPKRGGQQVVWSVATDRPVAALTFDDGPHPSLTDRILEILDRYRVQASFLMLGHCAEAHPSLVADVVAAGHDVGNHSWRHLNLAHTSADDTRLEIEVGARKIEDATGRPVSMFRPPRGRLNEAALRILAPLRQDIVLWSVTRGALDWRSPARIGSYVVEETGPGDIIDLHDGLGRWTVDPDAPRGQELLDRRLAELAALPRIIEGVGSNGIDFVRLSALLPSRAGIEPEAR